MRYSNLTDNTPIMYYFEGQWDSVQNTLITQMISTEISSIGLNLSMSFEEVISVIGQNKKQLPNHFLLRINNNAASGNR